METVLNLTNLLFYQTNLTLQMMTKVNLGWKNSLKLRINPKMRLEFWRTFLQEPWQLGFYFFGFPTVIRSNKGTNSCWSSVFGCSCQTCVSEKMFRLDSPKPSKYFPDTKKIKECFAGL